jgi:hypothetical protein
MSLQVFVVLGHFQIPTGLLNLGYLNQGDCPGQKEYGWWVVLKRLCIKGLFRGVWNSRVRICFGVRCFIKGDHWSLGTCCGDKEHREPWFQCISIPDDSFQQTEVPGELGSQEEMKQSSDKWPEESREIEPNTTFWMLTCATRGPKSRLWAGGACFWGDEDGSCL